MIDPTGIGVRDFGASFASCSTVLSPLVCSMQTQVGADLTDDGSQHAGYGHNGKPSFRICTRSDGKVTQGGLHIAVLADDRAGVGAFHAAALAVGAKDSGSPGLRPQYHPNYCGAFVLDPDGHTIEAVRRAESH